MNLCQTYTKKCHRLYVQMKEMTIEQQTKQQTNKNKKQKQKKAPYIRKRSRKK